MPIFAAIGAFLARFVGWAFLQVLVTRLLVLFGVAAVSYAGFSALMAYVVARMQADLSGAPAGVVAILHIACVDKALSYVLSACVARLTMAGMTAGGVVRKMQWRGPGGQLPLL